MARNISELVDDAAEGGVLASLIYHPEYLLSDNNLQPRFFYRQENQVIYWGIEQLVNHGVTKIDPLNLRNSIYSNHACQKVIEDYGLSDFQEYINVARSAARGSFEEYILLANRVISLAFRREMCSLSVDLGRECFNLDLTLDELHDYASGGVNKVAERFVFGGDSVQFAEKVDSIWAEICDDRNEDGTTGIPNLISSLDDFFTLGKGEMVLVAGATGKGKSSYFLAQSCFALQHGTPVVVIDSELTDKVYLPRLLANLSGVKVRTIKEGRYTHEEEERIKKSIEYIKNSPGFVHEYCPVFSKLQVDQICRKWYNRDKLGLLVYDYIKPNERYGAAEVSQSMGLLADYLKGVAGSLNIPVLAGLQLNRVTGDLADSFKTERYADVLMFWREKTAKLVNEDGLACGNFAIQVIKNRNGAVHDKNDYIDIRFVGDLMLIEEAEKHAPHLDNPFEADSKKK